MTAVELAATRFKNSPQTVKSLVRAAQLVSKLKGCEWTHKINCMGKPLMKELIYFNSKDM